MITGLLIGAIIGLIAGLFMHRAGLNPLDRVR